ncbi:PrsW family intramembrane metalloprotease [Marinilabilia salmonicolor]|uniref:PrsW family intramembrane metalloprotease n=1 Tax=Marinilabilia salmonicolor TaxID=989 RepID=UPI00029A4931|nr:PrsW family intramembrane metalloprotease [Marinilabilia salmonicolor]
MIFIYSIIALFIALIWIDYFRNIDIFEKENLIFILQTFLLGGASVFIVLGVNKLFLEDYGLQLNGKILNDFVYSTVQIGVLEEFTKLLPFVVMLVFFKAQLNEPIDYLIYICVSALGFSAVENAMYFHNYGPLLITGRAILSTVSHMFDSALVAYGLILYKFHSKYSNSWVLIGFFMLGSLSHGVYDFGLFFSGDNIGGIFLIILYFLVTVSLFAVILNNALNNSRFFSYKKVINSSRVINSIFSYYGIVFVAQFLILMNEENFEFAFSNLTGSIISTGFIVIVTTIRLSRFKLIKDRWHKLKLELPFSIVPGDPYGMKSNYVLVKFKGESFNEICINEFYNEYFYLCPLTFRNSGIGCKKLAFVEKKLFFKNDLAFYLVKVFDDQKEGDFEYFLLRAKTGGMTRARDGSPITAILKAGEYQFSDNPDLTVNDFDFLEWGVMRAIAKPEDSK